MNATYETALTMRTICCSSCKAVYALQENFCKKAEQDGRSWTCPHCNTNRVFNDNENTRLKQQLADAVRHTNYYRERKEETERERDHFKKSRDAVRGVLTRVTEHIPDGGAFEECAEFGLVEATAHAVAGRQ